MASRLCRPQWPFGSGGCRATVSGDPQGVFPLIRSGPVIYPNGDTTTTTRLERNREMLVSLGVQDHLVGYPLQPWAQKTACSIRYRNCDLSNSGPRAGSPGHWWGSVVPHLCQYCSLSLDTPYQHLQHSASPYNSLPAPSPIFISFLLSPKAAQLRPTPHCLCSSENSSFKRWSSALLQTSGIHTGGPHQRNLPPPQ